MRVYSIFFSALFSVLSVTSSAQLIGSVHGSAAVANYPYASLGGGGGVRIKSFLTPSITVGVSASYLSYGYNYKQSPISIIRTTDAIIPLTVTSEVFLAKGVARPYIGVEAGAYLRNARITIGGDGEYTQSSVKAGVAPKLGVSFQMGSWQIFTEGSYHFLLGSTQTDLNKGVIRYQWAVPPGFWAFNLGVGVPLGISRKK